MTNQLFTGAVTVIASDGSHAGAQRILGRMMSEAEIIGLTGAPDGATIRVEYGNPRKFLPKGKLQFTIEHPLYESPSLRQLFVNNQNQLELHNEFLHVDKSSESGFGTYIFAHQVRTARELQVELISVYAAGRLGDPKYNGYYTWAVVGYESALKAEEQDILPESLQNARYLSEVVLTDEGRRWWKVHGSAREMLFDLTEGSESLSIFMAYLERKGIVL